MEFLTVSPDGLNLTIRDEYVKNGHVFFQLQNNFLCPENILELPVRLLVMLILYYHQDNLWRSLSVDYLIYCLGKFIYCLGEICLVSR